MPLGRRLVRGALASLFMTGLSVVLGLANSVLLGRLLGPENFGLYSFAMILVIIIAAPFTFGMVTLLTRETGRVMVSGKRSDMGVLLDWTYRRTGWVAFLATASAAVLAIVGANALGSGRAIACLVALPMIGLSMVMPINSALLRGVGGLVRSQFCDLVARPSLNLIALLALLAVLGGQGLNASVALIAQILAVCGATALSGYWLYLGWRELPNAPRPDAPAYVAAFRLRAILAFSAFASLSAIFSSVDSLLLNLFVGNATLGVYRVAMVGVQLIIGFTAAINTIVQPSIASLYAAGDSARLQRLLTANARATVVLAAIPVAVLAFFAAPLLRLGFGAAYVPGASALMIAAFGQLLAALAGPVANLLVLTGNERTALRCLVAGTALNAGLCLVLIPRFGMSGAAVSTSAGLVLTATLMSLRERDLTGLSSSVFGPRPKP